MKYFGYSVKEEADRFRIYFPGEHPLIPGMTIFINKDKANNLNNLIELTKEINLQIEIAEKKRKSELSAYIAEDLLRLSIKVKNEK